MNIWEILLLFFVFQAVLFSVFLLFKKSTHKTANIIWAIFLLLFSYNVFYSVLYWSNFVEKLSIHLSYVFFIPVSLYGPLFYLYIKTLTSNKKIQKKDILHFLPFLVVILNFGQYYFLSYADKIEVVFELGLNNFLLIPKWVFYLTLTLSILIYSYAAYQKNKKYYTKDSEMKLWLKIISLAFALFGVFWAIFIVFLQIDVLNEGQDYFLSLMMAFFVSITSYFGFNYADVFNGKSLQRIFPLIKYEKSGLSKRVLSDYKKKLQRLMELDSPYLDSELKLTDLAEKLNVSRHHASQIINECFEVSFYEYINKYRIDEAERLLADENSSDLNITDIAYKSGFNNRMSFYNAFRKHVGITPSEFRNKNMMAAS